MRPHFVSKVVVQSKIYRKSLGGFTRARAHGIVNQSYAVRSFAIFSRLNRLLLLLAFRWRWAEVDCLFVLFFASSKSRVMLFCQKNLDLNKVDIFRWWLIAHDRGVSQAFIFNIPGKCKSATVRNINNVISLLCSFYSRKLLFTWTGRMLSCWILELFP